MAYKRRRKKSFINCFKNLNTKKKAALLAGVIVLILLLVLVIFVSWKFSKLKTESFEDNEIIVNEMDEEVGVGYTNFVLFGGDSRTGDVDKNLNTDSIIIVSLNNETKEAKMVSVYRDTLLDLSNGKIQKCNAAYSKGGAKQAINMLNMNLDLNIQKYVTVDFGAVVDVIDMLGGIEVDVSEAEMKEANKHIAGTAAASGKKATYIKKSGLQTLNGVQATTYARIRKGVGDDFARTERQRLIIQLAAEKAMKADLATLNNIIDTVFPQVATNLTLTEILKYAKDVTKYKIGETTGFPFEKGAETIPGKGSCVYPISLFENVQQLHEFLYGTVDYQPSKKVQSISYEIESLVESKTSGTDGSNKTNFNANTTGTGGSETGTRGSETGTGGSETGTGGSKTGTGGSETGTGGSETGTGGSETGTGGSETGTGGSGTGTGGSETGTGGSETGTGGSETGTGGSGTESGGGSTETGGGSTETTDPSTPDSGMATPSIETGSSTE